MSMLVKNDLGKMHMNLPVGIPPNPKVPAWKSHEPRQLTVELESGETFSFSAMKASSCHEVLEYVCEFLKVEIGKLYIMRRDGRGNLKRMQHHEECPSYAVLKGVKSFRKPMKQYEHPVVVVGAGLGGIQCMIELKKRGRQDFIGMEKIGDYGGWSWTRVPNKFTKLQTERGTYYAEYCNPEFNPPKVIGDTGVKFKTWPSRDCILHMMREGARARGLDDHTMFNVEIQKITPKNGSYAIQWTPSNDDDNDGGLQLAAAVSAWPGFLHEMNTVDWPGEEDFIGYIEYSSFDRFDYTRATGKQVVMYGHGAFTIENVRTLCEFRAKKVHIVCRTRNLCGTKMTSWLVGHNPNPCPATVILDSFKRMFDLVGYDVWTCPSVVTDKNKTFAYINQKTIFGVTDIYFLAGYYGLMEVTVDEIKRCSKSAVHTRNKNKRIECSVIIKAIGTAPSWKIAKQLGIKHLIGSWANGDPLRPVCMATKGVAAQNFGSFSIGPGLAPSVKMLNWFIDFPEDWNLIKDAMPINKPNKWPAYVTDAVYPGNVIMTVQSKIPTLAAEMFEMDALKAAKTNLTHPVAEYLQEAKSEWEMYIKYFKEHGMIDGKKADPVYPYTIELMNEFDRRADESWAKARSGIKQPKEISDFEEKTNRQAALADAKPDNKTETITVNTDGRKTFTFPTNGRMKIKELYELVGQKIDMTAGYGLSTRDDTDMLHQICTPDMVCPSVVYLSGVDSLRNPKKEYEHPIVVLGAGLGGIMCSIDLKHGRGRDNFLILERCSDFGGYSWIAVPNKFTKLQTERGTYFTEYLNPDASPPKLLGDGKVKFKTWPSRDSILQMSREGARARGLEEHTRFNTELQKITPKGDAYAIQVTKSDGSDADAGIIMGGAVTSWVGFLHEMNTCEWPGEEDFGGYIEYSSFDRFDYTRATGKRVVMYGHGAFTIENVRTLCEFRCQKVDVVCRYRNLCGTKMTSWLVGSGAAPAPATVILDSFKQMFDLVGYDVWKSPSVKTNSKKSFALIEQKTIFGVTDVYFLAGYYGLMEVTIDEISRCSHHTVHTKNLKKKFDCEVIIKAIGTAPSWKIHKQLGIKTVFGQWINNDPLRPVSMMTKGVSAQNFGTFSIGPGLASITKMTNWFLDWPEDYEIVRPYMPQNKQDKWPLYVSEATYPMGVSMAITGRLPSLAIDLNKYDTIKAIKTNESHPVEEYLGECKAEWEMYTQYFKDNNMVDDRPDCPYPYTVEMMKEFKRRADESWGIKA